MAMWAAWWRVRRRFRPVDEGEAAEHHADETAENRRPCRRAEHRRWPEGQPAGGAEPPRRTPQLAANHSMMSTAAQTAAMPSSTGEPGTGRGRSGGRRVRRRRARAKCRRWRWRRGQARRDRAGRRRSSRGIRRRWRARRAAGRKNRSWMGARGGVIAGWRAAGRRAGGRRPFRWRRGFGRRRG